MAGFFIVIEGCEGAGKSTAVETVCRFFKEKGVSQEDIICTREPGGTYIAEKIRTILKEDCNEEMCPKTELLLMYASRNQLVETIIKPAIASGKVVVGDRHDLSSIAYQGAGRGIDRELIEEVRDIVLQGFRPDLTLVLDLPPEIGLERAKNRGQLDRFEKEDIEFFNRIRNSFLTEAKKDPKNIVVIDASKDLAQVTNDIEEILRSRLCIAG
jgi:dTMP kinase